MTATIKTLRDIGLTVDDILEKSIMCVQPKSKDMRFYKHDYLDLETYIRVCINNDESFRLPVALFNDDILKSAEKNTLSNILFTTFGEIMGLPKGCFDMDIITSKNNMFGASAILFPDVFKAYCEKKSAERIYIIPSSIHELIVIHDDDCFDQTVLSNMVRSVNASELSENDVLSDHAYIYDINTNEITY